jgi:uncharacterized membrane protein (DUF4010 family)
LTLGSFIALAYYVTSQEGTTGQTTEVSAVVTYLAGSLCYWDYVPLAAALSVATTVLLSLKPEMRSLARNVTQQDIYATLKFAVISAIVLPILPNETFGPLDVLNPYQIWLMVVFISGFNFLGYLLMKLVGPRQGIGLTGLFGGIASSTALTLSFTERSHRATALAKSLGLAIMIAWTVMFARVLVVVGALQPVLLSRLWPPLAASMGVGIAYIIYLYLRGEPGGEEEDVEFSNPFELGPALKFGLLYALFLLVSKAMRQYLGQQGLYLSSLVAGLTDVDAITLSIIDLSQDPQGISAATAARAIVLAAMSNTAVKGGIVVFSGAGALRRTLLPGFLLMIAAGLVTAFLL